MSLTPADLQRALDALGVLGSLDAAAAAAGCSPAELVAALRILVPGEPVAAPSRRRRATDRAAADPSDDLQPQLPGLASRSADDEAARAPREKVTRLKPRASKKAVEAAPPAAPEPVPAPPARAPRTGSPRLSVVPSLPVLHIDAGSRGNPGPAACAFVARIGDAEEVHGKFLGRQTNNEAEYEGLLEALRWLTAAGHRGARLHMDSQLVVMQVNGAWKVREPRLVRLANEARTLLATTGSSLHHVMREKNRDADREVNRVLDAAERG